MKTLKEFTEEFDEITLAKIFEIEVIRKDNGKKDWVVFDIVIDDEIMVANHEPLTEQESKSNKIAFKKVDIDTDFDIDTHLYELYYECTNAIIKSDFFELSNEN